MESENKTKLTQALDAFQMWRRTRRKKGRIPEELWILAVGLLSWYRPSLICKTLGLNQNVFNQRARKGISVNKPHKPKKLTQQPSATHLNPVSAPGFLQIEALGSPPAMKNIHAVIDKPSGSRFSLHIPSATSDTLATLVHAFLSNDSCSK